MMRATSSVEILEDLEHITFLYTSMDLLKLQFTDAPVAY